MAQYSSSNPPRAALVLGNDSSIFSARSYPSNLQSGQILKSGIIPSNHNSSPSSSGQYITLPQSQLPFTSARHTEQIVGAPAKQIEWRFKERVRCRLFKSKCFDPSFLVLIVFVGYFYSKN